MHYIIPNFSPGAAAVDFDTFTAKNNACMHGLYIVYTIIIIIIIVLQR